MADDKGLVSGFSRLRGAGADKSIWLVSGLFFLLVLSLTVSRALIENSQLFGQYRIWLVAFIFLILAMFVLLIVINVARLIASYVAKRPGSKLTLRLTKAFVVLMLIPALTVYWFSSWLVEKGMDSWFDADIELALQNSIDLSRWSLESRKRSLQGRVEAIALELSGSSDEIASLQLESFLEADDSIGELTLLHSSREVIATASREAVGALMALPPEAVLREVGRSDEPYAGVDLVGENLYTRLVFPVISDEVLGDARFLQVLYPMPQRVGAWASSVENAFTQYNQLVFLRDSLKQSFILTLTLVLFLGVVYAGWAALYFARRLAQPIAILDEGTQAVAAGKLDTRLERVSDDEFGSLVESFNEMTRRLAAAQNVAEINRFQLERQRSYLQTVLEHVSSGVISLDEDMQLKTANTAASEILLFRLDEWINKPLREIAGDSEVGEFLASLSREITSAKKEWQKRFEYVRDGRWRILVCRGTCVPEGGYVIVINDVTDLVQAQRHQTWGEIAQRMAHEFKNPLTPIQLSAERLKNKLSMELGDEGKALLGRSTTVITQQVEAMKRIVDDFSQFARSAPMDVREADIKQLIEDVVELYLSDSDGVRIEYRPSAAMPLVCDAGRIRQLLHNLLTNATEALAGAGAPLITITTESPKDDTVEIQIRDNGPGFAEEIKEKAFEPYVTNKAGGTGLGLAIVKRIAEEHNGYIRIDNTAAGALVKVTLRSVSAGQYEGQYERDDRTEAGR